MIEKITIILLGIMWLYSSTILFLIVANGGNIYIKGMPIGNKIAYNFIPLCLITNYFDKYEYE
jgi:hypothetical protein